jgi:predicted acylesterase/phospholipase RssA
MDFWQDLTQANVFQQWSTSYYDALFHKSGVVNNSHFIEYIHRKVPKGSTIKRAISVGAFDINSGHFKRYDENLGFDKLLNGTRGSASLPFIFQTQPFQEATLIDGGVY